MAGATLNNLLAKLVQANSARTLRKREHTQKQQRQLTAKATAQLIALAGRAN